MNETQEKNKLLNDFSIIKIADLVKNKIIDGITYGIDESGFTLTQSFAANYK